MCASEPPVDGHPDDVVPGRTPTRHERLHGPWDASYTGPEPAPWDLGRPQHAIAALVASGAAGSAGATVLDAGCGTGEHALLLAARGCDVLGVDVAPTAIAAARAKAAARGVTGARFAVGDALALGRLGTTFDHVLDVGLFHTFDDDERTAYVAGLSAVARPGTTVHLLAVSDAAEGEQGPRRVGAGELRDAFATGWDVLAIDAVACEVRFDPGTLAAWLARIERR
jgi:cyclopropane fatty-acyl-phospholipid synthase-like methyltransferase